MHLEIGELRRILEALREVGEDSKSSLFTKLQDHYNKRTGTANYTHMRDQFLAEKGAYQCPPDPALTNRQLMSPEERDKLREKLKAQREAANLRAKGDDITLEDLGLA